MSDGAVDWGRFLAHVPKGGWVLDCRCVAGQARVLKEALPSSRLVGVIWPGEDVETVGAGYDALVGMDGLGGMTGFPFASEAFAGVVGLDVLSRLRLPELFLSEVWRVLQLGGGMMLTAPNVQFYKTVAGLAEGHWRYGTGEEWNHIRFYTAYEISKLLEGNAWAESRCGVLRMVDEEEAPLDKEGYMQVGRVRLGPLEKVQYDLFRTKEMVALAVKGKEEESEA